jgi:hypothetical protein
VRCKTNSWSTESSIIWSFLLFVRKEKYSEPRKTRELTRKIT